MRVVAIVQARMGSSRLSGKVLAVIQGDTMLARVVGRLRAATRIDDVVIATSLRSDDDAVVHEAGRLGAGVHRGSESDVLDRFLGAARAYRADAIVRVTSDCPLVDPGVIDRVVAALGRDVDYASNTHVRTFPRGLECEAFHRDTLERIARIATSAPAREHVTAYLMERPELFQTRQVVADDDCSDLRWTVDTIEDLTVVRALYAAIAEHGSMTMPYRQLVDLARARPELAAVNAHIVQKPWNHVA